MRQFQAIPVYPLRMRGRFGLAGHIYRHGFWSMTLYTLLYTVGIALLWALALVPTALVLWRSGAFARLLDYVQESAFNLPYFFKGTDYGMGEFLQRVFGPLSHGETLLALFGGLGLGALGWGAFTFWLKPWYLSTAYNEMAGRVYGTQGSLTELCKRSGPCLRRYYTTYLARMVGRIGAGAVAGLLTQFLNVFVFITATVATVLSGGLAIGFFALLFVVAEAVKLALETFLVCAYPVGVSEDAKAFSALGRSLSLGFANFGRIFASLVLRSLLLWAFSLPAVIVFCIALLSDIPLPLFFGAVCYRQLVRMLYLPYSIGFDTVLYFDAQAREPRVQPVPPPAAPGTPEAPETPAAPDAKDDAQAPEPAEAPIPEQEQEPEQESE